jgi:transposase
MNPSSEELVRYLHKNYPGGTYHSVYEAGYCGYWIHRELPRLGFDNIVINPADVPTSHKEKSTKTGKIDSRKLARELENRNLNSVYIPEEKQQQLRSLCRLRFKEQQGIARIKNRIISFCYLYGIQIPSQAECGRWSKRFIKWLEAIPFAHEAAKDCLQLCIDELKEDRQRLARTTRLLRKYSGSYRINQVIDNLCTVPGIGFLTAMTFYTEIIDMTRFRSLDVLCSFVGLVPTLHSSGERQSETGLSSRCNRYLKYLLIEAAWIAVRRDPAMLMAFHELSLRMKKQEAIIRIAKKLLNRIRYVWLNGKPYVTAVA